MALTDAAIRKTAPQARAFKKSDGEGLYMQFTPTGSKRWRLDYQYNGKRKTISLGIYPRVSLKEAREARDDAKRQLLNGLDPSAQRQANKQREAQAAGNAFEAVAREWHDKYSVRWADSHSIKIIRRLELDVFPILGKIDIADITAPELLRVLRLIEDRGAVESAHRVRTTCGQIFRYGIATARCDRDVAADLRGALPPVQKNHFAAVTEPEGVGELLRALHGYQGTMPVRCALKLAPLVFVRPGELRQALWADIDLDGAEWRYHVSKTDSDHIVPLSTQALEILRELEPFTGRGQYVFPSGRGGGRPLSDNGLLAAMRKMDIPKEQATTHGWRATARTLLDEVLHFRPEIIEHQLAHKVRDALGRSYNRTKHLEERAQMMQAWADYLDRLRTGADVIQLTERRN